MRPRLETTFALVFFVRAAAESCVEDSVVHGQVLVPRVRSRDVSDSRVESELRRMWSSHYFVSTSVWMCTGTCMC
jgi:hypothetical protein